MSSHSSDLTIIAGLLTLMAQWKEPAATLHARMVDAIDNAYNLSGERK